MRIALELDMTECQVLLDCLNASIRETEVYNDAHEEYWDAMDEEILEYKLKLRSKIQKFTALAGKLSDMMED